MLCARVRYSEMGRLLLGLGSDFGGRFGLLRGQATLGSGSSTRVHRWKRGRAGTRQTVSIAPLVDWWDRQSGRVFHLGIQIHRAALKIVQEGWRELDVAVEEQLVAAGGAVGGIGAPTAASGDSRQPAIKHQN